MSDLLDKVRAQVEAGKAKRDYVKIAPFMSEHRTAWETMKERLGADEAYRIAQMPRNGIFIELRTKHGWSLESVGEAFELSRERIRQLTPPGLWLQKSLPELDEDKLNRVLTLAARTEAAWVEKGQRYSGSLRRDWLEEQMGQELPSDFTIHGKQGRGLSKLYVILRYGLELETKADMLEWAREQYYRERRTYENIAKGLSMQFVYISTMHLYRGLRELGFRGYSVGRRHDLATEWAWEKEESQM